MDSDLEQQPRTARPRCPVELGNAAKREWHRIAPELYRLGLLTTIDRAALAGYCAMWGSFIEAAAAKDVDDLDTETARRLCRMMRQSLEFMFKFMAEFGMSPAARARVRVTSTPPGERVPEDEAFLARRGLRVVDP